MNRRGFTLLEMLAVIAIIGMLVGILIPVVNVAQRQAWKMRTRDEARQLAAAWDAFLIENRRFPDRVITEMDKEACEILAGIEPAWSGALTNSFYEFNRDQLQGGYTNRWGTIYQVMLDCGRGRDDIAYDGRLPVPHSLGGYINKSVAVWADMGTPDDYTDDLKSWK